MTLRLPVFIRLLGLPQFSHLHVRLQRLSAFDLRRGAQAPQLPLLLPPEAWVTGGASGRESPPARGERATRSSQAKRPGFWGAPQTPVGLWGGCSALGVLGASGGGAGRGFRSEHPRRHPGSSWPQARSDHYPLLPGILLYISFLAHVNKH